MAGPSHFSIMRAHLLLQLYNLTGGKRGVMACAPPRAALAMFGGPFSIQQFRHQSGGFLEVPANMTQEVQEALQISGTVKKATRKTHVSFEDLVGTGARNEPLRLRRPAAQKKKQTANVLSSIMGCP